MQLELLKQPAPRRRRIYQCPWATQMVSCRHNPIHPELQPVKMQMCYKEEPKLTLVGLLVPQKERLSKVFP